MTHGSRGFCVRTTLLPVEINVFAILGEQHRAVVEGQAHAGELSEKHASSGGGRRPQARCAWRPTSGSR